MVGLRSPLILFLRDRTPDQLRLARGGAPEPPHMARLRVDSTRHAVVEAFYVHVLLDS